MRFRPHETEPKLPTEYNRRHVDNPIDRSQAAFRCGCCGESITLDALALCCRCAEECYLQRIDGKRSIDHAPCAGGADQTMTSAMCQGSKAS